MMWCYQLFIVIVHFALSVQNRALHEKYRDHYEAEKQKTDQKSVPFERVTQLYSKASKSHVQIIGRRVDALGEDGSPYGKYCIFPSFYSNVLTYLCDLWQSEAWPLTLYVGYFFF